MYQELQLGKDPLSKKQTALINRALHYAAQVTYRRRHAAIVVKSGRVLAHANNKFHNVPHHYNDRIFNDHYTRISTHAEIAALRNLPPETIRGCTIYVGRVLKNNTPGLSRPCPRCEQTLRQLGVKRVIYS